jgi:hypothetical protein
MSSSVFATKTSCAAMRRAVDAEFIEFIRRLARFRKRADVASQGGGTDALSPEVTPA